MKVFTGNNLGQYLSSLWTWFLLQDQENPHLWSTNLHFMKENLCCLPAPAELQASSLEKSSWMSDYTHLKDLAGASTTME